MTGRVTRLRPSHESGVQSLFQLLYVIPNGDNPTGITMSEKRRREIYDVVCKYDLLIAEDDPYYFIYFGAKVNEGREGCGA